MKRLPGSFSRPGQSRQRKIHYIDQVLQKWLLVALVVLEIVVLSVAGWVLYYRLNSIVDESLYRIHFSGQPSMFSVMLRESLWILAGLVAVNLLALFAADRLWSHYVRGILQALRDLLLQTRALDLRESAAAPQGQDDAPQRHRVLALALAWQRSERTRHLALRAALAQLESLAAQPAASSQEFRQALLALQAHLPAPERPD